MARSFDLPDIDSIDRESLNNALLDAISPHGSSVNGSPTPVVAVTGPSWEEPVADGFDVDPPVEYPPVEYQNVAPAPADISSVASVEGGIPPFDGAPTGTAPADVVPPATIPVEVPTPVPRPRWDRSQSTSHRST